MSRHSISEVDTKYLLNLEESCCRLAEENRKLLEDIAKLEEKLNQMYYNYRITKASLDIQREW